MSDNRQMQISEIGNREVDRAGSHPGELVVPGFNLGDTVMQGLNGPFTVIGYYRGNVVLKTPANGCTHHGYPSGLKVV